MAFDKHQAFLSRLGFGGVSVEENDRAKLWARRFEWPMIIAALWIIVDWYLSEKGISSSALTLFTDWFIWLCFIVETGLVLSLVDNKKRYIADNWMNVLIILMGLPIIWGMEVFYAGMLRSMRLLLMLGIFLRISTDIRAILSRNNLGMTLFICFLILLFSGFMISGIDPAFETPLDGIWWAWVTVTTVGYGDLVPSTTEGRLFGALLILMGLGLFSMLTASFSVFFIAQDEKEMLEKEADNIRRINQIESQLNRIESQLERTVAQLEKLQPPDIESVSTSASKPADLSTKPQESTEAPVQEKKS